MSEKDHQLHHCERCAAVFSAPAKVGAKVICSECGESPVAPSGFVSRAQAETVVDTDKVHGVAGKDVADFVSMQKLRRKKQIRAAIVLWGVLLVAVPMIIFYFNGKKNEEMAEASSADKERHLERKRQTEEAIALCPPVFDKFIKEKDENIQSAYVVGGVRQLLKLKRDLQDLSASRPGEGGELFDTQYFVDGEYPRFESLLLDDNGRKFELVFWKVEGEWKLDWEQYVRYSSVGLKRFLDAKKVDEPREFCLYARRRYSPNWRSGEDLEMLFYQPTAELGRRLAESPQVNVSKDDSTYIMLLEAFKKESMPDARKGETVGRDDPPGVIRIRATLSFVEGADGQPQLNLAGLKAFHWMAFDP